MAVALEVGLKRLVLNITVVPDREPARAVVPERVAGADRVVAVGVEVEVGEQLVAVALAPQRPSHDAGAAAGRIVERDAKLLEILGGAKRCAPGIVAHLVQLSPVADV